MNHYTFRDGNTTYERISRRKAKALWEAGNADIVMVGAKMRPGAPWHPECPMGSLTDYRKSVNDGRPDPLTDTQLFNSLTGNFRQYNCSYEQGYYVAFYLRTAVKAR